MKRIVVLLFMLFIGTSMCRAQEKQGNGAGQEMGELSKAPAKAGEVQALVGIVRVLSKPELKVTRKSEREAALRLLGNPDPAAKEALQPVYQRLLDDDDEVIKGAAAHACAKLQLRETAPKILDVLSKAPRSKFSAANPQWMTLDHMEFVDSAAEALVDLGHEAALDEILSRDELMVNSSFGGPLAARFGAKGLPKFVELAQKKDQRRNGALAAIDSLRDEVATSNLISLLDNSDYEIAQSAAHALAETPIRSAENIGVVIEALKKKLSHQDRFVRGYAYSGLIHLNPKGELPAAMRALQKDADVRLNILYALIRDPVKEAVPYLKDFIATDEKWNPNDTTDRSVAAQAIFKATGERVPYKGVERELGLYEKGLRPDPYDPVGKNGLNMKRVQPQK